MAQVDTLNDELEEEVDCLRHILGPQLFRGPAYDMFRNVAQLDPQISHLIRADLHAAAAHRLGELRASLFTEENGRAWRLISQRVGIHGAVSLSQLTEADHSIKEIEPW